MRAVLHCINNRHKEWGRGWEDVIAGKNQFSSMTVRGDSQTIWLPTGKDDWFDELLVLASKVYSQSDSDPTLGATFYYNPVIATSDWFKKNIVDSGRYVQTVILGKHCFFKSKDV